MKVGVIGLGRMGKAIAYRLLDAGHEVVGYDLDKHAREEIKKMGGVAAENLEELAAQVRIYWLMVPVDAVGKVIVALKNHSKAGDIFIDGGNSNYKDSIIRARDLEMTDMFLLDCGVSGGIHGRANGFCLMVGGDPDIYIKVHDLFAAIAAPGGVARVGSSGTGHYVKMIHNGIEYGLLQAYAEGMHLMKDGTFKEQTLDLEEITRIWNVSSIIRSFILELAHDIFKEDQELHHVSGEIAETGMGRWTVEEAHATNIPARVIEEALRIRAWSRETGGNYATKVVAMLRKEFGGHAVKKI